MRNFRFRDEFIRFDYFILTCNDCFSNTYEFSLLNWRYLNCRMYSMAFFFFKPMSTCKSRYFTRMAKLNTLSAWLALCEGNHWLLVDPLHEGPVMKNFDVFFAASFDKLFHKQSSCCFMTPIHSCDVTVIPDANVIVKKHLFILVISFTLTMATLNVYINLFQIWLISFHLWNTSKRIILIVYIWDT